MVRAVYSLPLANMNLEGVYTPLLPVDRFATSGRWTPAQVGALTGTVTMAAEENIRQLVTACEEARTGLAAATTLATSSEAQAKAAQEAAAAYAAQIADYTTKIAQLNAGIAADPSNKQLQAQLQQATIALVHCTAEKTAQETAAAKYAEAAKEAATAAETYKSQLTAADTAYTLALNNTTSLADNIYPDLWTLKYSQFGGRATWTLGQIDMGISYYNGWYKQPSFNGEKLNDFVAAYLKTGAVSEKDKFLAYDKKQTFGLEASSIIWHFNVRGEFAYNLTDDMDGKDPWVHNNSIAWLGGFDIDLPFWNANLNVQETGSYILNGGKCDDNYDEGKPDVDYDKKGYTNDKIVANLTTSFLNDKVAPEVTVMYGIERGDLVVMPKLAYKPDQNLTLTASGMIINCADKDSEFYGWKNNSFASIGVKYQF